MIGLKAMLISALGLRAIPAMTIARNERAHDAAQVSQGLAAGLRRIGRLGEIAAEAEAHGNLVRRDAALQKQSEVRAALDDLTRRLD